MPAKKKKTRTKTPATLEDAFGQIIREQRLALGLTQVDLEGEDAGLEQSYISRLEAGKFQVCLRGIFHLAKVLNMTPADLLDLVDQRFKTGE